jgi:hypothetical protein
VAHPLPDYERDSSLRELLRSARYARLRFAAPAGESGSTKAEQFTEKNLHRPSSGDYEDPPEEREDKKGTFYRLSYTAAGSSHFSNIRGYFHTLEDSVHEAEKVFTGIKWKS